MLNDPPSRPSSTPFAEARVVAARALDLAQRHRVPPFPRAYEVWFTYATGLNPDLSARIDAIIARERTLPPGEIDRLHAEFLSPGALNEGMARIGDRMDAELADVIDMLETGIAHGDRLDERLSNSAREIDRAERDPAALRRIAAELAADARAHLRGTRGLGEGLEKMRKQFTAMTRELRELRQSVLIDHLTQLPNRRFFDDTLARLCGEAREGDPGMRLVLVGLDHFARFNERWGRRAGDTVLERCASIVRGASADGDFPCRVEGDLFALILSRRTTAEAVETGNRIRAAIADLQLVRAGSREQVARLSASVGLAALRAGDTPAALFGRAETTLLEAKARGRDMTISAA